MGNKNDKPDSEDVFSIDFILNVLAQIEIPVMILDEKGLIVYCNNAVSRNFGLTPKEMIGKICWDFVPPQIVAVRKQKLKECIETGSSVTFEDFRAGECWQHSMHALPGGRSVITIMNTTEKNMRLQQNFELEKLAVERTEELRRTRDFLQCVIDSIPQPLAVKDSEHRWILVNKNISEIFQMPVEDLIGKTDHDFIRKEEADVFRAIEEQVFSTGNPNINEEKITESGGRERWHISEKSLFTDPDGNKYLLAVATDITERKKAEEALRQSEDLLLEMTTQVPGVVYQFYARPDGKMGFNYVSESSEQILGLKPDLEGYFERFTEMVIPEHREEFIGSIVKSVEKSCEWKYEGMIQKPTGEKISFSGNSNPKQRKNEMVFNGIVTDITERKKVEDALQHSLERLEEAQRIAKIGNWEANLVAGELYWSKVIFDIFGFDSKSFKPSINAFRSAVHPDDGGLVLESEKRAEQTGSHDVVHRIVRPDKETRFVHELAKGVTDDKGKLIMLRGTVQDITELKNAEEELRNYREHLERLVEERTAELKKTTEQLLQSQKMEAIGQLAGGIAHDFNNIIATIKGTAELLVKNTPSDAPMIKQLTRILNSIGRASTLTTKLLTFARKEKLNVKTIHPKDIVSDVIDVLKSTTSAKINVSLEFEDGAKKINADSNQIFHAVLNMCLNACDAMPQGGELNLGICSALLDDTTAHERGVESGEYAVISIQDTGTGVDGDKIDRIFEPFFTTKDTGKGSGLGLSVSHGIINAHGGHIKVQSEKGKGTTFSIFLPVADSLEDTTGEEENPTAKTAHGNILIIDDDQEYVQMMKESLESEGFGVTTALSGKEAINHYKDRIDETDIILLDMLLPEMNGTQIFFALKELNPTVKIVLCSGYSIEGDATMLLEKGALAFMQKPFDLAEVVEIISDKIQKDKSH